jgi:hypothetical protein
LKCTWTCRKNYLMRELTGKMPPETATHALCEPARTLRKDLKETWRAPDGSRARALHVVRSCAVQLPMDMSQEPRRC